MSTLFSQLVDVPKCCLDLPTEAKCLPCRRCVLAWEVRHEVNSWDFESEADRNALLDAELRRALRNDDAAREGKARIRFGDQVLELVGITDVYQDKKGLYVRFRDA